MSITITARAVPAVASSSWEMIDQFLLFKHGDWDALRNTLINELCSSRADDLGPVSALERLLLAEYFTRPPVFVGFREVLALVRQELALWPEATLELADRMIASGDHEAVVNEAFRAAAQARTRPGRIIVDGCDRGVEPADR